MFFGLVFVNVNSIGMFSNEIGNVPGNQTSEVTELFCLLFLLRRDSDRTILFLWLFLLFFIY